MNRHFYGESHGPDVDSLRHMAENHDFLDSQDGVLVRQSWRARIIDDELYIEATLKVYHENGRARVLRQHLDRAQGESRALVCGHVGVIRQSSHTAVNRARHPLRELDQEPGSSTMFVPISGTLKSCRNCFTDYRLDVEWRALDSDGPKGWVIGVTRWHQLGSCRSPEDDKWRNYARHYRNVPAPRMSTCEAGAVYRRWRKQEVGSTKSGDDEGGWDMNASFSNAPEP
jgi:hypothetical protein